MHITLNNSGLKIAAKVCFYLKYKNNFLFYFITTNKAHFSFIYSNLFSHLLRLIVSKISPILYGTKKAANSKFEIWLSILKNG